MLPGKTEIVLTPNEFDPSAGISAKKDLRKMHVSYRSRTSCAIDTEEQKEGAWANVRMWLSGTHGAKGLASLTTSKLAQGSGHDVDAFRNREQFLMTSSMTSTQIAIAKMCSKKKKDQERAKTSAIASTLRRAWMDSAALVPQSAMAKVDDTFTVVSLITRTGGEAIALKVISPLFTWTSRARAVS